MINKVSFKLERLDGEEWSAQTWGMTDLDTAIRVAAEREERLPGTTYRIVMVTEEPIYAI